MSIYLTRSNEVLWFLIHEYYDNFINSIIEEYYSVIEYSSIINYINFNAYKIVPIIITKKIFKLSHSKNH